jgi:hypothetical protein
MKRLAGAICFGLLVLLGTGPAYAAPVATRAAGIARKADKLVVSVGLQDLFGPRDIERLLSGFSTRVLIRVALLRDDGGEPIAQAMRLSEIVYDLWDEKLRVRISTDKPGTPEIHVVATPNAAVDLATALVAFSVAEIGKLEPGMNYHLGLRADLNPISEELVSNVRRWLSRPSGRSGSGSGDSFFGSFVSVFVNPRIDDSERQLQVVSQSFAVPGEPAP